MHINRILELLKDGIIKFVVGICGYVSVEINRVHWKSVS